MPEGVVILPLCSNCHDLTGLHLITVVPPTQRELSCSVCHPETSVPAVAESLKTPATGEVVETPATTATEGEEPESAETEKSIPGYTASLLAVVGLLAYAVRRMR
jgi:hypothetical protein